MIFYAHIHTYQLRHEQNLDTVQYYNDIDITFCIVGKYHYDYSVNLYFRIFLSIVVYLATKIIN